MKKHSLGALLLGASLLAVQAAGMSPAGALYEEIEGGGPGGSVWYVEDDLSSCAHSSALGINDAYTDPDDLTAIGQQSDAFDDAFLISVNDADYDSPAATVSGQDVIGQVQSLGGFDVQSSFHFFTDSATMRQVVTVSNPAASAADALVEWAGDMGSDGSTEIITTTDGDVFLEDGETYVVSRQGLADPASDPVVTLVPGQPGAPTLGTVDTADCGEFGNGNDEWGFEFAFTVPAGETRTLLLFSQLNQTAPEALAGLGGFSTLLGNPLVSDLSADLLRTLVNWDVLNVDSYRVVTTDGSVGNFGPSAPNLGAAAVLTPSGVTLDGEVVGIANDPDGTGFWMVTSAGKVIAKDTEHYGDMAGVEINAPVVGIAAAPDGSGYYLVGADGGVFAFGSAVFAGSMGAAPINQPVFSIAADPDGAGYWLVALDGGVFAFDATFFGSAGGTALNAPVVDITADPFGGGYWLVSTDGGVFAYGTGIGFFGSAATLPLNEPVVAMTPTGTGLGYWLVATDGGVFAYGDAEFSGAATGALSGDVIDISAV